MRARLILPAVVVILGVATVGAQEFEFYPGARYNPEIPTLKEVVGHAPGERITPHAQMEQYVRALSEASPNVEVVEYGRTWEGRALYYLIVASEANLARVQDIKTGMQKLADPRRGNEVEAENLIKTLPSVCWLAYGVHGNEISSTDAGLLTAYHLAAAQGDSVRDAILEYTVVLIDPMQNPDGRQRFIQYFRQTRGRWPDPDQQAAEHNEAWPGGRTNHYLFDMNRDWFALTQPETRGRVRAYLEWFPQVFVDLHEMGSNSTYYFAPPADPLNPEMPRAQVQWLERFGRNNAAWFDRMQFDYFTREVFDSFYPGYGEGWPMFHGSIGMTYEQASTRGLVVKREDETTLHYRDAVQHHFISSLSTAYTAARGREALLRYFYEYRKSAVAEGRQERVKEYILPPGKDPNRTTKLANLLLAQGIEVKRATESFSNARVRDYVAQRLQSQRFPAGTYVVSLAQPAKRLVKNLLEKHTPLDETFVKEQVRRYRKRLNDEIYDVTGWSLPLLFDVDAYVAEVASRGAFETLTEPVKPEGRIVGEPARVAYLIPWGSQSAAHALALLHRAGIRVFTSDKAFALNDVRFPSGSLIVKVKNNPADLHEKLGEIAAQTGVTMYATHTAWVENGVNFGSGNVRYCKKPKVAMAYDLPVHPYSVGWARYLLEQVYEYPVTLLNARQIARFDLSKYNVLILPNSVRFFGSYGQVVGKSAVKKLKDWVEHGGTLITFGEATRWLTDKNVGLLATTRELRGGKPERPEKEKDKKGKPDSSKSAAGKTGNEKPFDLEEAIQPEKELPGATPGAIVRVKLDTEFWPAFGYEDGTNVLVSSRNIFRPLKLDKGRNIGVYEAEDKLVLSGFTWEDTRKQLANKAYLMHQRHGRGHVIAFAEDPNFRAFADGLNVLFLNAVFFGPAH